MNALLDGIILVSSLTILSRAASVVVEQAAKLSKFFGISEMAIGFLFISIITTLPELSVAVVSSTSGEGAISVGNVFGSVIANILFIIGLAAALYGVSIPKEDIKNTGLVLLLTILISAYLMLDMQIRSRPLGTIEGLVLIGLFFLYSFVLLQRKQESEQSENGTVQKKEALASFLFFVGGIVVVLVMASFVVNSASNLARAINISESFIGATIVALGTSLPELSIILAAARTKRYGIVIGNATGANVVNMTLVLGTTAAIQPVSILIGVFSAAIVFSLLANVLLLYNAAIEKRIHRVGGIVFILLYVCYLIVIFGLQAESPVVIENPP